MMKRVVVRGVVAALALTPVAALAALAQGREGYYGHMWDGWGWGYMIFGPLTMILVVAAVVAVIVLVVRWLGGPAHGGGQSAPGRSALDILKERYARGEIDTQEFEERKKTLGA